MGRKTIRRGPGQRSIERQGLPLWLRKSTIFQRRAAEHDGRIVTVGPLSLFSTDTGAAWLLDPADHLAARLARDGDPESIHFEETDTTFAIGWKGSYHIDGDAFGYIDRETARVVTILG